MTGAGGARNDEIPNPGAGAKPSGAGGGSDGGASG